MNELNLRAHRFLRRHLCGLANVGERFDVVRMVIDSKSGRITLAVHRDVMDEESLTLHLPNDDDDSLHMMGEFRELDSNCEASCDRYLMYFGAPIIETTGAKRPSPAPPVWLEFVPHTMKFECGMVEADEVMVPNPLWREEGKLCKHFNAMPDVIAGACTKAGVEVVGPKLVGVDPWGADVRASFGHVRLEFEQAVASAEEAIAAIESWRRG